MAQLLGSIAVGVARLPGSISLTANSALPVPRSWKPQALEQNGQT